MYTSELFGCDDPWSSSAEEPRDIHVGLDIGGPVGTQIHSFADGVVHSAGYNAAKLDYGHGVCHARRMRPAFDTADRNGGLPPWTVQSHNPALTH